MTEKLFSKNFTLLVWGQVSSLFGNNIIKFALSMYVLDTMGSAKIFASILSIATIPTILLSPLGGILADRANRKNIMVALDTLSGIFVLCAALLFTEQDGLLLTGILLVCLSVLGAFESPTVQACVPQMQSGNNIIKGNAVVNQVAAVAALIAPILGSVLYTALGLKPVLYSGALCFFITATFECFIKLDYIPIDKSKGILSIIRNDFLTSMRFIRKEQSCILKMLFLSALVSFFVMGTAMVGLPYIVRNVLSLNAEYYGFAESALGFVAINWEHCSRTTDRENETWKTVNCSYGAWCVSYPGGYSFLSSNKSTYKIHCQCYRFLWDAVCRLYFFCFCSFYDTAKNA